MAGDHIVWTQEEFQQWKAAQRKLASLSPPPLTKQQAVPVLPSSETYFAKPKDGETLPAGSTTVPGKRECPLYVLALSEPYDTEAKHIAPLEYADGEPVVAWVYNATEATITDEDYVIVTRTADGSYVVTQQPATIVFGLNVYIHSLMIKGYPAGGTIAWNYNGTTGTFDWDSTAAEVETALSAIPDIDTLIVRGGPLPYNPIKFYLDTGLIYTVQVTGNSLTREPYGMKPKPEMTICVEPANYWSE